MILSICLIHVVWFVSQHSTMKKKSKNWMKKLIDLNNNWNQRLDHITDKYLEIEYGRIVKLSLTHSYTTSRYRCRIKHLKDKTFRIKIITSHFQWPNEQNNWYSHDILHIFQSSTTWIKSYKNYIIQFENRLSIENRPWRWRPKIICLKHSYLGYSFLNNFIVTLIGW